MKKIIVILFLIIISCTENNNSIDKKIKYSNLSEPEKYIYIELLSYYPALNKNQSNFYVVKDIHKNDTLFVVDQDTLPVSDFIKNYNGLENTAIIVSKGQMKNKAEYIVHIPSECKINNENLYLGELIRLID